jgi:tetratricopeptide (TPR) repeat protein
MNAKIIWLSILAVVLSFVGGFYLANSLNRTELNTLRAENESFKKNPVGKAQNDSDSTLSDDEIRQKIVEADNNPTNFSFQRNMGLALYRYGAMKQDAGLIAESARLLQRAFDSNPQDYDVIVALGNVNYDIGYFKKENKSFEKSREFYQKALAQKPADADVRTDLGLTYFLADPPDIEKAVAEFQKSLESNPKHERSLQFMIQALLKQNKRTEAEKYHARLKAVNPQTPDLDELDSPVSSDGSTIQK